MLLDVLLAIYGGGIVVWLTALTIGWLRLRDVLRELRSLATQGLEHELGPQPPSAR